MASTMEKRVIRECERDIRKCLTQLERMQRSRKEKLSCLAAQQVRLWLWAALEEYQKSGARPVEPAQ